MDWCYANAGLAFEISQFLLVKPFGCFLVPQKPQKCVEHGCKFDQLGHLKNGEKHKTWNGQLIYFSLCEPARLHRLYSLPGHSKWLQKPVAKRRLLMSTRVNRQKVKKSGRRNSGLYQVFTTCNDLKSSGCRCLPGAIWKSWVYGSSDLCDFGPPGEFSVDSPATQKSFWLTKIWENIICIHLVHFGPQLQKFKSFRP